MHPFDEAPVMRAPALSALLPGVEPAGGKPHPPGIGRLDALAAEATEIRGERPAKIVDGQSLRCPVRKTNENRVA